MPGSPSAGHKDGKVGNRLPGLACSKREYANAARVLSENRSCREEPRMPPSPSAILPHAEPAKGNTRDSPAPSEYRPTWVIELPPTSRRWLAFFLVLGTGLFTGTLFPPSPGFFLWLTAGFLAVVSGFAGLWSG